MGLGIVFSGQGNQNKDMFTKYANVLNIDYINSLADKLGISILPQIDLDDKYCDAENQKAKSIFNNIYAQPLLAAYEFCVWDYLKPLLPEPIAFTGYSLGEVTAIACASNFSFNEVVEIAQIRAKLMSDATEKECGMLAVSGVPVEIVPVATVPDASVQDICNKYNAYISIKNSAQKAIIGGELANLDKCDIELKRLFGNVRTQWLKTNVAAHTPLLASAKSEFTTYLSKYTNRKFNQRVISGINAHVQYDLSAALTDLSAQICQTIYFDQVIQVLFELGVDLIIEIGPGCALANIIRQQNLAIQIKSVDDFKSLADIPAWVNKYVNI